MDDLWEEIQALGTATLGLLAAVLVVQVWLRTRSFAPTVGALLVGAIALWGITNPTALRTLVFSEAASNDLGCRRGDAPPFNDPSYCDDGALPAVPRPGASSGAPGEEDAGAPSDPPYSPAELCEPDLRPTPRGPTCFSDGMPQ